MWLLAHGRSLPYTSISSLIHRSARLLKMELPDPVYSFRGDMGTILCLLLSNQPDSDLLYVGTSEGFVHIWNLKMKRLVKKVRVSEAACSSIAATPTGFATFEKGESVKIWNKDWSHVKTISSDYCGFCNILYLNGEILLPGSDGKMFKMTMDGSKRDFLKQGEQKLGELMCVRIFKKRNLLVACFESGLVSVLDDSGNTVAETTIQDTPMCLDLCESTGELVVGTSGSTISKFSLCDALKLECQRDITNPGISCLAIRQDGKLCAASCWDKRVRYFSMKTLKLLAVLDLNSAPNCLAFGSCLAGDEGFVYVGDSDGRVTIWNLYNSNKS